MKPDSELAWGSGTSGIFRLVQLLDLTEWHNFPLVQEEM